MAALDDLLVLDFSRVLAGPLSTMLLADFGATVVKVERPGAGDDTRHWGPPHDERGVATYFQSVNRNKRSVTADFQRPADLAAIRDLARRADVIVENFRPGLLDELGLGYDALAAEHPRLIYCSISGFGRGAGAALPGYDLLIQAVGGLMSITGAPDGEPQKVGVALVDVVAGLFATTGILTALHHRERTGEGQRVEVDLLSSLLAALVNQASSVTGAGVVPGRMGNAHPSIAPYEVFPTGAGELVLAVGTDRQFQELCRVLDRPALAADERFATNERRVANRAALREAIVAALARRSATEWAAELLAARVPAGEVNDVGQALRFAAGLGLDPVVALPHPDGGTVPLVRNPVGLSKTPPRYESAPPALGEPLVDALDDLTG